jgi:hypothetical protein
MYNSEKRVREKDGYDSLGEALAARSSLARKRGKRFKTLRPYQVNGRWFLTKMGKGQAKQYFSEF